MYVMSHISHAGRKSDCSLYCERWFKKMNKQQTCNLRSFSFLIFWSFGRLIEGPIKLWPKNKHQHKDFSKLI